MQRITKFICAGSIAIMMAFGPIVVSAASSAPKLTINGSVVAADDSAVLKNGAAYVSLRYIAENQGYVVSFDDTTQTINLGKGAQTAQMKIDSPTYYINGEEKTTSIPPFAENGRTYVHLGFVKDAFGLNTYYNSSSNAVLLTGTGTTMAAPVVSMDVMVNGKKLSRQSQTKNGIVYLPTRQTGEALGYTVKYNSDLKMVSFAKGGKKIVITFGKNWANINNQKVTLEAAPYLTADEYGYAPMSFFQNLTSYLFNVKNNTVNIGSAGSSVAPPAVPASAEVTDISYDTSGVSIHANSAVSYSSFILSNPDRIVIDIPNAVLKATTGNQDVNAGGVQSIRSSQFSENVVRVVLDVDQPNKFKITQSADKKSITVTAQASSDDTTQTTPPTTAPSPPATSPTPPTAATGINYQKGFDSAIVTINSGTTTEGSSQYDKAANTVTTVFQGIMNMAEGKTVVNDNVVDSYTVVKNGTSTIITYQLKSGIGFEKMDAPDGTVKFKVQKVITKPQDLTIYISAGHGGKKPGSQAADGTYEHEFTLKVAKELNTLLKNAGYHTIMSREKNEYVDIYDRTATANKAYADFYMSIHFNAFNGVAHGLETLYYPNTPSEIYPYDNKKIAQIFQEEIVKELKLTDRGVVDRSGLVEMNSTKMPAILCELGFIDNPTELATIKSQDYYHRAACALARAITRYYQEIRGINLGIDVNTAFQ